MGHVRALFIRVGAVLAGALLATSCGSAAPQLPPTVPSLRVHNRSGGELTIEARTCGQADAPPTHAYTVGDGRSERFEPGETCFDFVAVRGGRVVGRQTEVRLRHEMDWVIDR